jgi:hypothetical protein
MLGQRIRDDAEFLILVEAKCCGPLVGFFGGHEIYERVEDSFGRVYVYAGVIERIGNGRYNSGGLRKYEFILEPGLIYRMQIGSKPRAWEKFKKLWQRHLEK